MVANPKLISNPLLTSSMHGKLSPALEENVQNAHNCQWLGVRSAIKEWQALTKDKLILQAITKGVRAPLHSFPKPNTAKLRPCKPHPEITKTIGEYLQSQAVRLLNPHEIQSTNYWVPIFGREKKDSEKVRLITDLRDLNNCHNIQQHKPQTWKQVVELTQDQSLTWGVTLDLKAYYHHLQLHNSTARWIRFQYQDKAYQAIGMPFGWSMAPFWSHRLAKPIRQRLQEQGIPHAWFVDDVLILGQSAQQAAQNATYLVKLLTSLGIQINKDKSMTEPAQQFKYLGHHWDLQHNKIHPIPEKITKAIKAVKHQIKGNVCTAKHMASLAGMLLDQVKSNVALWGLPKQLMRSAGHIVAINKRHLHHPSLKQLWHTSLPKRHLPYLPQLLLQSLTALQHPISLQLRPNSHLQLILQTDASDQGWGASLIRDGKEIANCAQHWTPDQRALHITHREGSSLSPSSPQSPRSHSPKLLPFNPSRRHINSINLEQGIQDHRNEQTHHTGADNIDPERGPGEEQPHTRQNEHPCRLPEPPARRQKLSPEQGSLQRDLQSPQLQAHSGSVREQTEQTGDRTFVLGG